MKTFEDKLAVIQNTSTAVQVARKRGRPRKSSGDKNNQFFMRSAHAGKRHCIGCGKNFESPHVRNIQRCNECKSGDIEADDGRYFIHKG